MRLMRFLTSLLLVCLLVLFGSVSGCESAVDPETQVGTGGADGGAETPSLWHQTTSGALVAMDADEQAALIGDAVQEARATAETARLRWVEDGDAATGRWAIKWAAPTKAGTTEYLWVEPIRWSPFRVEGRLASAPHDPLTSGRQVNEPVNFPVEQLIDWVRFAEPDFSGAREGGFTIDALAARFGDP